MTDFYAWTDKAIMEKIGEKLKKERLNQNISQAEMADISGLSAFTISGIENHGKCSLTSLVQLLRALQRLEWLEPLLKEEDFSPIEYAKFVHSKKQRQRSSKPTQLFER